MTFSLPVSITWFMESELFNKSTNVSLVSVAQFMSLRTLSVARNAAADSGFMLPSVFAVRFFRLLLSITRVTPGIIKNSGCATVSLFWKQNEVEDLLWTEPHLLLLHVPLWSDEV